MPKLTTKQRRRKLASCGPQCFGDPSGPKAKKAGRPRYPICGSGCDVSCKEAHKAWARARQQHERKVSGRILRAAKLAGCRWAGEK